MITSSADFFWKFRMRVDRDAAAVVGDGDEAVGLHLDLDPVGVAGQRLVHGVVDDFGEQVMQRLLVGAADIHAGPAAHRLEPFQHLDVLGRIAGLGRTSRARTRRSRARAAPRRLAPRIRRTDPASSADLAFFAVFPTALPRTLVLISSHVAVRRRCASAANQATTMTSDYAIEAATPCSAFDGSATRPYIGRP